MLKQGENDTNVDAIRKALDDYEQQHQGASAALYRQNPGSIRVRIIDPRFAKMSRSARHDVTWNFLAERIGDDCMSELSLLLLLSPNEVDTSLMNAEFENPVDSHL